jgi:hypothetical protein
MISQLDKAYIASMMEWQVTDDEYSRQMCMPKAEFETTASASKQSRPTRQTARRLGPAIFFFLISFLHGVLPMEGP